MIGEIKNIEVGDKKYELKKVGVTQALVIQGLFIRLLITGGAINTNISDKQIEMVMAAGINTTTALEMKEVIKSCVFSPKINDDKYEDLPLSNIPELFYQIYLFNVHDAEKKTNSQSDTGNSQT